jgi:hypothetical protein
MALASAAPLPLPSSPVSKGKKRWLERKPVANMGVFVPGDGADVKESQRKSVDVEFNDSETTFGSLKEGEGAGEAGPGQEVEEVAARKEDIVLGYLFSMGCIGAFVVIFFAWLVRNL